jgi:prepilin-type N-terminal cleavage/methylation domain-containing protein
MNKVPTRMKKKSGQFYNLQFTTCPQGIYNRRKAAFTLVEILIVVAILGILAAIVLPEFQGHIQQAKEAQAKDNLRILRETIERYAAEHNDVPPGYGDNDPINRAASGGMFINQTVLLEKYLSAMPKNPINNLNTIKAYQNNEVMPTDPLCLFGWLYQPATKTIRLDSSETDSNGVRYFDY